MSQTSQTLFLSTVTGEFGNVRAAKEAQRAYGRRNEELANAEEAAKHW